ncbi:hypothetical protein H8356DRAFT_1428650 [Neocallimastix lanati (nom. inval.)]|uniref:Uncharacterized protein n=1 Tax=Neocallimastix californiae TaxID=1754190 RepID=A0A1Y1Z9G0_9FUNG|nr:hypothetical protein H8356DRAFT_1428650 [Neocallimastix sp. JGI-2020a]ORY06415.1 hypothetical protein LY90DRAFT_678356 [Neocallimastix californiae]|eukprot:ORY06415.1 hypothetical protein LY90DRAFT_678356 [Neocallimastix californiae]
MVENMKSICVIDEKYVSKNRTFYKIENLAKYLSKINCNIYNNKEKKIYHCEKDKFLDVEHNTLFEYKVNSYLTSTDLNIFIPKSNNNNVTFKSKAGLNIDINFFNKATNENTILKVKNHFLKSNIEIYDENKSLIICSVKKDDMLGQNYTIEITEGIDTIFMLIVVIVLINVIKSKKAGVGSASSILV